MNLNLLKKLYTTHSPSHQEKPMSKLIQKELKTSNIPFEKDNLHQLYRIIPGKPILVHHMDQIQKTPCDKITTFKNRIYGFSSSGTLTGLGADDKNGIFIALTLIKKFRDEVSFIFSAGEEAGGKLSTLTKSLDLTSIPYGLIFDRKGDSDIIGTSCSYCCDDLETGIRVLSGNLGYKPTQGLFSDADELSNHVPCVNLSCGYYNAHTVEEWSKLSDIHRALQLGEILINSLPRKDNPFELADKYAFTDINPEIAYGWRGGNDYWNEYDKYSKNSKSLATTSTPRKISDDVYTEMIEEITLEISKDGASLVTDYGEEEKLCENPKEVIGSWDTKYGTLNVIMVDFEIEADIDGIPIEVISDITTIERYDMEEYSNISKGAI